MIASLHDTGPEARPAGKQTRALAEFVSNTTPERIPPQVMEHAKWDILDSLGCALFGQTLPIAGILRRTFQNLGHRGEVVVWGDDWSAVGDTAALINGTMTHSFELDDLHKQAIVHPGGVTLPAALAVAQLQHSRGADLLAAHVVGLEACTRVGLAAGVPLLRRGWHNNGVLGVFGGASAAANLLRLDPDRAVHALGIAGSLASGLMAAQFGAMVKRMHAGYAAHTGLRAALLAAEGFTGIETVFEEPYGGYLSTFADSYELQQVAADLGTRWETLNVGFKFYSACGSSHTTIDVLLSLKQKHRFQAKDVDHILVRSSTATRDHVGWPYVPNSVTTAQMNLGFAAAVAILDGQVFVDQFQDDRLRDSRILQLARRVEVIADPAIDAAGPTHRHEVGIEVRLTDGSTLSGGAVHGKGSPAVPLSRDELKSKFLTLAGKRVGESRAMAIFGTVMDLETLENVNVLTDALRGR